MLLLAANRANEDHAGGRARLVVTAMGASGEKEVTWAHKVHKNTATDKTKRIILPTAEGFVNRNRLVNKRRQAKAILLSLFLLEGY
jgi:hypothetical protein